MFYVFLGHLAQFGAILNLKLKVLTKINSQSSCLTLLDMALVGRLTDYLIPTFMKMMPTTLITLCRLKI